MHRSAIISRAELATLESLISTTVCCKRTSTTDVSGIPDLAEDAAATIISLD